LYLENEWKFSKIRFENTFLSLTFGQDLDVFGGNTIARIQTVAAGQRVLNLVTQFQGGSVPNKVAKMKEDLLILIDGLDKTKMFLKQPTFLAKKNN
jgi:hypothetical protein